MEVVHKERGGGAQTKPFVGAKVDLYKERKRSSWNLKVNLILNLPVIMILSISGA
jgi:hypothetical protein